MEKQYIIKPMCAHDQMKMGKLATTLMLEYLDSGTKLEDLVAVCGNATRIYCTAYLGEDKAFTSPLDVMNCLSLEEMASLLCKNSCTDSEEASVNESFKEQ